MCSIRSGRREGLAKAAYGLVTVRTDLRHLRGLVRICKREHSISYPGSGVAFVSSPVHPGSDQPGKHTRNVRQAERTPVPIPKENKYIH